MAGPGVIGTEFQHLAKEWYSSNDKSLRDAIRSVVSRNALALNQMTLNSTTTVDYRYSAFVIDTSGGAISPTLPFANVLGSGKSSIMYFIHSTGNFTCTLTAQAGNTIDGGTTQVIQPGDKWLLISDGNTAWYALGLESVGTWTPVITFTTPGNLAITYSVQIGDYVRIGNFVSANFRLSTSAFTYTTATGNLMITGLPFTASSTPASDIWHGTLLWGGITKAGYTQLVPQIVGASNQITVAASGSGVAASNITTTDMPSGGSIVLRGSIQFATA